MACLSNETGVLQLLLQDERVDFFATDESGKSLLDAALYGEQDTETIGMILADPRIDQDTLVRTFPFSERVCSQKLAFRITLRFADSSLDASYPSSLG
jgi:hypothetical protein